MVRDSLLKKTLRTADLPSSWRALPPSAELVPAMDEHMETLTAAELKDPEWNAYNHTGSTSTAPLYVRSIEGEKVCLECADKTGRAQTHILNQCPQHARDSTALLLEFLHSPCALRIIADPVNTIARAKGVVAKLNVVLQQHPGHPADLIGDSFNPWKLQKNRLAKLHAAKAARELRKIAANSRCFLSALTELGHKGGIVPALFAASAEEMEGVLAASPGWRSFRVKNALRIRQPSSRCPDHGRHKKTPAVVLAGSGPRRVVSQRLGTTVWATGKRGRPVRKVAVLHAQNAAAIQLWTVLIRQAGATRVKAFQEHKAATLAKFNHDVVRRVYSFCEQATLTDYGAQFAFCEESQLLARLGGAAAEEDAEAGSDWENVAAGDEHEVDEAAAAGGA
ncbi:unnamed protein product [Prorocentrum cordatum]|uniref:Uncharacterized protein n=1 Tax=Prorocentrum cordatum TaxID=2364126 RepID=A0ABN9UYR6_9DINO|nr:unnamed protein product [Polarella glacialis]